MIASDHGLMKKFYSPLFPQRPFRLAFATPTMNVHVYHCSTVETDQAYVGDRSNSKIIDDPEIPGGICRLLRRKGD